MRYLNEDFIDTLDQEDVVSQASSDNKIKDDENTLKIQVNFIDLFYQQDILSKYLNPENVKNRYNIFKRFNYVKNLLETCSFIGHAEYIPKIYICYTDDKRNQIEKEILPEITPVKKTMMDFVDAQKCKDLYGQFSVSFQVECIYVAQKTSFRRFISDIQRLFFNVEKLSKENEIETNIMLYIPGHGWYQSKNFKDNSYYAKFFNGLYPGEREERTSVEVVYKKEIIEDILKEYTAKNEQVVSWRIEKRFFDPTLYNNHTNVYVARRDVLIIHIDATVEDERSFYGDMLTSIRQGIFDRIPLTISREFSILVYVHPDKKFNIPQPLKRDTRFPPKDANAEGYCYMTNYNSMGGGNGFKSILPIIDRNKKMTQEVVAFSKPGNPMKFDIRGKFTFMPAYKWLQLLEPENP